MGGEKVALGTGGLSHPNSLVATEFRRRKKRIKEGENGLRTQPQGEKENVGA